MLSEKLRNFFSFPLALGSVLAILVYFLAGAGVGDPDLWWHMRNAQYLLRHGQFLRADIYSYTAAGYAWVNYEWLAEVPYYLAWRAFGLVGLNTLRVFLVELMMFGIFYLTVKVSGNVKGAFLATCYAAFLAVVTFGPRTILFGYIYLVILLLLMRRLRTIGQAPLWVLPLLFCLWINTHGSWLLGVIIFCIIFASGLLEGKWGQVVATRWTPKQLRQLIVSGIVSLGALFINPYGYRLVTYPFDLAFRQKLNVEHGAEWASVNFNEPRGKIVLLGLLGLLLLALWSRHEWKLEELGVALFALYSGLVHVRFLCLIAVVLTPLLAKGLNFLPPYRREIDKPVLNSLIFFGALVIVAARFPSRAHLENDIAEKYPVGAFTFMKSRSISGRFFNYYGWGGYLGWEQPEFKVFVDSRTDIFEYAGVIKDYLNAIWVKDTLAVLDKYRIQYVLMPPDEGMCYLLKHTPGWNLLYNDQAASLFERAGLPAQQAGSASSQGAAGTAPALPKGP
jgi:hypothetical protein